MNRRLRGRATHVYWKYFRTRRALFDKIMADEVAWCGKPLSQTECWEFVEDWKMRVRY